MCNKLAVMYAGRIVEAGTVRELFNAPQHPYTKALLGSMPRLGSKEKLFAIPGQPPDLATLPTGCAFHPRCREALPRCRIEEPLEMRVADAWRARCWRAEEQSDTSRTSEAHVASVAD
jgi:oligopeptide/dipeptide ABC transporter ATP-binding protein